MTWVILLAVLYILLVGAVCIKIIYDTDSTVKTLAYLLLAIFFPIFGIFFYFSFGLNYRKRKIYSKKIIEDDVLWEKIKQDIFTTSEKTYRDTDESSRPDKQLSKFLAREMSPLTSGNKIRLLVNGEEKFPEVLQALEGARNHIHIGYYIYENDTIGKTIEEILIRKSKEGVKVRFMYDDFGSRGIRKNLSERLRKAGVEAYPFYKINFIALANRLNYRNHRKIIVIDGRKGFVGGINVSDRYINSSSSTNPVFWRDTHLMLDGPAVHYLQYLFISDWNFCVGQSVENPQQYFPDPGTEPHSSGKIVQFASSGPDSDHPTIVYSLLDSIYEAQEEILITTPYLIPEQSVMDAIMVAALGGVSVQLLVPAKSDSKLVELAAASYYDDLMAAGVKIYSYQKGFVHAKTMVVDSKLAMVGTANMDFRSFDLNFEVNAIVYDSEFASNLAHVFEADITHAVLLDQSNWSNRSVFRKFTEKVARLLSPLL